MSRYSILNFHITFALRELPLKAVIAVAKITMKADVGELSLIFRKPLIYGLYLRVDALTGIDHG